MKRITALALSLIVAFSCMLTFGPSTKASAEGTYVPWRAISYAKSNNSKAWACSKYVAKCVAAGGFDLGDEDSMTTTDKLKSALDKKGLSATTLTLSSYKVKKSKNPNLQIGDPVFCYCSNHKNYPHVLIVDGFDGDDVLFACTNNSHWDIKWTFNNSSLSSAHADNDSCKGKIQAKAYFLSSLTFSTSSSPANSMNYNNHIYERYDYNLSWNEAKAFCEQKGGHLVTISDAAENDAIVNLLNGCPLGYYHIGATDPGMTGNWSWITGEAFSYNNWDPQGEPSKGSGEYYAAIIGIAWPNNKQVSEWIDEPDRGGETGFYCFTNGGFVCEYEPDTTPPTISDVSVTDISATGYTVTCKVSDNKGVARVSFPSWPLNGAQVLWKDGTISNGTATFRVNVSDHNGANGCTYVTHIYAYDNAGNVSSVGDGQYSVLAVNVPASKFYLNLDGYLDGETNSSLTDFGTADIYINGTLVASGWSDYWEAWPSGTTYEIKNIKAADGRRYNGVHSGSLSGTIGTEQVNVILSFSNIYTFTFDANGGIGSMPDIQTVINDPVVLPACGFTKDGCLFQGWEAYRPADKKYAIAYVGWRTEEEMTAAGLTPTRYPEGLSFEFNTSWTEGTSGPISIVLRSAWLVPDFILPTSLREIEAEAFEGGAFSFVRLPDGTASIGSRAFANCPNLMHIYIPASATSIDPAAFAGTTGLTIYGTDGSYAEFYAGKYGFAFIPVA